MWTPMWFASFESCFTDASQTFEIHPSLGRTCFFHEHLQVTSACKPRSCTPKSVARVCRSYPCECVHAEVTCTCLSINNFLAYHAKRRGRNVLVNLSRWLFFGPRADEDAGRLRDEESKSFIMWIRNACLTVSPTLTATDTTVPGMGDLRNGDMSSWIIESIYTLKDFLIFHQNWIYQW